MGAESRANPYPGLRPFEFPERHLFFGREGQTEELSRRLRLSRFLAVVGTSGSGKSSLVRAGLLPALYGGLIGEAGPRWRVCVLRPGNDPVRNLAAALNDPADFGPARREPVPKNLLAEALTESGLRVSSLGLVEYVRKAELPTGENLIVVVDQFEELFRFKKEGQRADADDEAAAFVKLFLEAARAEGGRVYVVITMRSDFLGDCAQFRDLPEAINRGQYLIPRMSREQLRSAVEAPARVHGARLAPRLVNRLLNDIGDDQDQLPILQHALMRTWDEWRSKRPDHAAAHAAGEKIDICCYEAIGGMAEALSIHADEAYEGLGDERRKKIAERLFKCLSEKDRDGRETRRRTTVLEVCGITKAPREEVAFVVETFRQAGRTFIMPPPEVPLADDSLLDISHESLIRNWKLLGKWVKEEAGSAQQYLRLVDAAALHRDGLIGYWRDPQLSFALKWREGEGPTREWARRYHPDFDLAMGFLKESEAERERERTREKLRQEAELARERELREKAQLLAAEQEERASAERQNAKKLAASARKLRWLAAALAVMFLLSAGTAFYAFTLKARAEANERLAVEAKAALSTTNNLLTAEKAKLITANEDIERKNTEIEKKNLELTQKEKDLNTALEEEKKATKRAVDSEAAMSGALEQARRDKERAEQTSQREVLNRSGLVLFEKGKSQGALGEFKSLLAKYNDSKLSADEVVDGRWWALHNLGVINGRLGDYDKAAENYRQALDTLGGDRVTTERRLNRIATLRRLGQLYLTSGFDSYESQDVVESYETAVDTYQRLLDILKPEDLHRDDPLYEVEVKSEFADLLSSSGEFARAKALYLEALEVRRNRPGELLETIRLLKKLSALPRKQDEPAPDFTTLIDDRVREEEKRLSPDHLDIAKIYDELAMFYSEQGKPDLSDNYGRLAQLVRTWNYRIRKEDYEESDILENLATAYRKVGKCDRAALVYVNALDVLEKYFEDNDPFIGEGYYSYRLTTLRDLARFYLQQLGDEANAEKYYAEHMEFVEGGWLNDYADADDLDEIARFYRQRGNNTRAVEVFRLAFEKRGDDLKEGVEAAKNVRNNVGSLTEFAAAYAAVNEKVEAEETFLRAVELVRKFEGDDHVLMTVPAMGLADFYLAQGRDRDAEPYYRKVIGIIKDPVSGTRKDSPGDTTYLMFPVTDSLIRSLIGLAKVEARKSPNSPDSTAAAGYFKEALFKLDMYLPIYGDSEFSGARGAAVYASYRAEILGGLAKVSRGEEADKWRKQADEARQAVDRVKAAAAQAKPQAGCS